jgi:hypothetical protein
MLFYELEKEDISKLTDSDLREMIARLCIAELSQQGIGSKCVLWGGAQEAADGGLDVIIKNAYGIREFGFVPRPNTGIQVKKQSMGRAACLKEMLDKSRKVKLPIQELASTQGAYIIISGKDDCTPIMQSKRTSGMREAISGLENSDDLYIDFYGRDQLLTWLRKHFSVSLWVRSRLGKPLSGWKHFGRWAQTPHEYLDTFLADDHPCVTIANSSSRDPVSILETINFLRARLREPGSSTRITGLSGVGKTRLAQALFEEAVGEEALSPSDVIYADLGEDLSPSPTEFLNYLASNNETGIVVLDNCPSELHGRLKRQIYQSGARISFLTIEYDISDDTPEETEVVHIEPASEETVSKLVSIRFPELLDINIRKISEFAGGNARVALALAARVEPDETLTKFSDEGLFKRIFEQRKGEKTDFLNEASALSLVYSFSVERSTDQDEISALAKISETTRAKLHVAHAELLRRQLCQKRGHWRAILPHALSNRLAKRALENIDFAELNGELFIPKNIRLFKSCAHRIGYLHDSDLARQLAETWVRPDAPLHNLSEYSDDHMLILEYIAPVFPEHILTTLEGASYNNRLPKQYHKHIERIMDVLCKIAFDDEHYERSLNIILRIKDVYSLSGNESCFNRVKDLFSLYLSGTNAAPSRRQRYLANLLNSPNTGIQELAGQCFRSALRTGSWSSTNSFHFGARIRSYGWEPKTRQEITSWYDGFLLVLISNYKSADASLRGLIRDILSSGFTALWMSISKHQMLEELVTSECELDDWSEVWRSMRFTLDQHGKSLSPEMLARLEHLERISSPPSLHADIETYVFTPFWTRALQDGMSYADAEDLALSQIVNLGVRAANDYLLLRTLGPRLMSSNVGAIHNFGIGLAKGAADVLKMFDFLVEVFNACKSNTRCIKIFCGFMNQVGMSDPKAFRSIQESVPKLSGLAEHTLEILFSRPLEPWGIDLLIGYAEEAAFPAAEFRILAYGNHNAQLSDRELAELIKKIMTQRNGTYVALDILSMRMFAMPRSRDNAILMEVARLAIFNFLSSLEDYETITTPSAFDIVLKACINEHSNQKYLAKLLPPIARNVKAGRTYSHDISEIICAVIKSGPALFLDYFYNQESASPKLLSRLLRHAGCSHRVTLNLIEPHHLIHWCALDPNKIKYLANLIDIYIPIDQPDDPLAAPRSTVLSQHSLQLLAASADKIGILDIFIGKMTPSVWSSLADILEVRLSALAALMEHSEIIVREYVKGQIPLIEEDIYLRREQERSIHKLMDQKFEN